MKVKGGGKVAKREESFCIRARGGVYQSTKRRPPSPTCISTPARHDQLRRQITNIPVNMRTGTPRGFIAKLQK